MIGGDTTSSGTPIFVNPENNRLFHLNFTNHAPLFYYFEPTLSMTKYEESWCVVLLYDDQTVNICGEML